MSRVSADRDFGARAIRADANRHRSDCQGRLQAPPRRALSRCTASWSGSSSATDPKAIQEFMGHATIEETFSRYGHLMPGARDQARSLVDAYMARAVALR